MLLKQDMLLMQDTLLKEDIIEAGHVTEADYDNESDGLHPGISSVNRNDYSSSPPFPSASMVHHFLCIVTYVIVPGWTLCCQVDCRDMKLSFSYIYNVGGNRF